MGSNSVVDMIEASSGVHFSGFHMDGLEQRQKVEQPTTSAHENMHKQPFVIGKWWFIDLLHALFLRRLDSCVLILPLPYDPSFHTYIVTGVAGGAASGKTTVCDMIIQQLHDQRVVLVNQVMCRICDQEE